MKPLFFLLILAILPLYTYAADRDYLQPVESIFTAADFQLEDKNALHEILFANLSYDPLARTLVCPSFKPEYVISFEHKEKARDKDSFKKLERVISEEIYLIYKTCRTNISQSLESKKTHEIISKEIVVDPSFAYLIEDLFCAALTQARFYIVPRNKVGTLDAGVDGTRYYYTISNVYGTTPYGTVWSPDKETKMGELTQISELLKTYAETNDPAIRLKIMTRSRNLIKRLTSPHINKNKR